MHLAERVGRIGESATLRVSQRAKELRAQGVEVVDFGVGEPDFPTPRVGVEAAQQALTDGFTKYAPIPGTLELRQGLAGSLRRRYGAPWEARHVIVTAGAKMALFELCLALLAEGDEVVTPIPTWVSFTEQFRFVGARTVTVPTSGADGFTVHADEVLAAVTERTRAVLINSPSNPTGGVIPAPDLERLVEGCAERGVFLISDETYERFVYDGAPHASAAPLAARFPETVILVGSFSKTYAMTGWRVGYAFAPEPVLQAMTAIQSHSTSNATSFAMVGALAVLNGAEAEVEAMIAEYQARRDLLIPRLNALPGVRCLPPAGSFYAFPDVTGCYRPGRQGSVELAEYLIQEAGVAVVPGAAFGSDDQVRISFACSRQVLELGLERLATALS